MHIASQDVPFAIRDGGLAQPRTWWFTGLPGAGKSTLGAALAAALRAAGQPACVVDGDVLRGGLCGGLGFSPADRAENVRRAAEVARLVNLSGIHAVVCLISPYIKDREGARRILGARAFIEVHVATPLKVCMQRDPKGLYAQARAGQVANMTGISADYEEPLEPALYIDTSRTGVAEALTQLLQFADPHSLSPALAGSLS